MLDENRIIENFYKQNYDTLVKIAKSYGADGNSKDIIQDSFLNLLLKADKYDVENKSLWPLMFTIIKNTSINYHRNKKIQTELKNEEIFEKEDLIEETNYKNILEDLFPIGKMDFGDVLFLSYIDGWKYKELSENHNLPLGTVKSKIFHARRKAQKNLKNLGDYLN
jgi:RNA polymerase sigma factor (sigma-70 family)